MESRARLKGAARNLITGKMELTFEVDSVDGEELDRLRQLDELRLKAVRWTEKRSLDANAYYYVLCRKIAEKTAQSLTAVCNEEIADYGQFERDPGGGLSMVIMKDAIDWKEVDYLHLRPTTRTQVLGDGKLYRVYLIMRGSHTYNSHEMSLLISGVVMDAKELGIETMTPDELKRMVSAWHPKAS